ncbi:MAG: FkbM family methyltransferase [Cyanobacteria bacterium SZAS-4]|nr:FkbM family methyltransferase [Cyanobacteria bacterium SZAS-4]
MSKQSSENLKLFKGGSLLMSIGELAGKLPRGGAGIPRLLGRTFCPDSTFVIETVGGAKVAVDCQNLDMYTGALCTNKSHDPHIVETCKRLVGPGDVFYDIGSNAGFIALDVAKNANDQAKVFAFEPQPSLAKHSALSCKLNGFVNMSVYEVAVSDSEGVLDLFFGSHAKLASTISGVDPSISRTIPCQSIVIDNRVESGELLPPNTIKIDIEGGEMAALTGAKNTIGKYHPSIIFEVNTNVGRAGFTRSDILDLIKSLGDYQFYFITYDAKYRLADDIGDTSFTDMLAISPANVELIKSRII